jgi:D-sedoheptulose 7-phosphate isomerase
MGNQVLTLNSETAILAALSASAEAIFNLAAIEAEKLAHIAQAVTDALRRGNKVLLCGNGGSAADSQHIAAELVGRFHLERAAWPAIALTTDSSILTSIGNDYSYDNVFERQVEALGAPGDLLFAISTSGNSRNVLKAARAAQAKGMLVVGFTGQDGGELKNVADICVQVPSRSTPHIQEGHIAAAHAVCQVVEQNLTGGGV